MEIKPIQMTFDEIEKIESDAADSWVKHFQNQSSVSLVNFLLNQISKNVWKEFDEKLMSYLVHNLNSLGYTFVDHEDFIEFCKKRITKVSALNSPDDYEFFLDYGTKYQKLIGRCNTETHYKGSENNSMITVTIGKNLEK